jgi:hypothetical protein
LLAGNNQRDFSDHMLKDLVNGQDLSWVWTKAEGHSGGTLTGVRNGDLDVLAVDKGNFYSSIKVQDIKENVLWEVINVYGPVQNDRKTEFLEEFLTKIRSIQGSFIMGEISISLDIPLKNLLKT